MDVKVRRTIVEANKRHRRRTKQAERVLLYKLKRRAAGKD
jgi:hypothetical protein